MPQILSVRHTDKGGNTQIQPLRNNNGTFLPFGNPYTPTNALTNDATQINTANMVVQFGAEFWCSAGKELRRYNPATSNWDLDTVLASPGAATTDPGIYLGRGSSGALRAAVVWRNNTSQMFYRVLDTPAGSWGVAVSMGLTGAGLGHAPGIVHNNQLHVGLGQNLYTLDFSSLGSTIQTLAAQPTSHDPAFCRAQNRLFCMMWPGNPNTNTRRNLYEFVGGAWVLAIDGLVETAMPAAGNSGLPNTTTPNIGMHYDEAADSLIAHTWYENFGGSHGWGVTRIPLTLTGVSTISPAVVPGGIEYPNGPLLTANDCRFRIEVDQDTDPLNPVTYVWISRDDGAWGRYLWNGVAALMTALGAGGDRGISMSHNSHGGGERFYDGSSTVLPGYHIEEVQSRVSLPGATRVFLRGALIDETGGSPTATLETVGLYWTKVQGQARNLATILNVVKVSGPVNPAPAIVGNKITNFPFDNTSIISVEWQADTDGLADQDPHALMPHLEL